MSKKDYELLAHAINKERKNMGAVMNKTAQDKMWLRVINVLSQTMAKDNSRFKSDKFLNDCGFTACCVCKTINDTQDLVNNICLKCAVETLMKV